MLVTRRPILIEVSHRSVALLIEISRSLYSVVEFGQAPNLPATFRPIEYEAQVKTSPYFRLL